MSKFNWFSRGFYDALKGRRYSRFNVKATINAVREYSRGRERGEDLRRRSDMAVAQRERCRKGRRVE